jgi:hypothetical protein
MTYQTISKQIHDDQYKRDVLERKYTRDLRKKVAQEFTLKNVSIWHTLRSIEFHALDDDAVVWDEFNKSLTSACVTHKDLFVTYDKKYNEILITNVFVNLFLQLTFMVIYFKILQKFGVDIKGL